MRVLFVKAHNKGFTKKDGTYVAPFEDKRASARPVLRAPAAAVAAAKEKLAANSSPKPSPKSSGGALPGEQGGSWPKAGVTWGGGARAVLAGLWPFKGSGGSAPKKAAPAGPQHPRLDDDGRPVYLASPTAPTDRASWSDPARVADFVPDGAVPAELHGVAFAPWADHPKTAEGWDYVEGQMDGLVEPALALTKGKAAAAGVVIEEPDGRVWVVRPSNEFAGYKATFPKGHADVGHSLQATAIKECFEESGLQVEITGLLGDVERTQTVTRYYRARRVGGTPAAMGWETQAVSLVPKDELLSVLNRSVDHPMAIKAGAPAPPGPPVRAMDGWAQVGPQGGSNVGGVFEDEQGVRHYCKFPKSGAHARNEVLAARLYQLAGVRVAQVELVTDDGHLGVASRILPGLVKGSPEQLAAAPGAHEGFAADCWLANWDSVGLVYDNMLLDARGRAVRLDTGGALSFRAQGLPKGEAFGDEVGEVKTLRSGKNVQAAAVFGSVPEDKIREAVAGIMAIPEAAIAEAVAQFGPPGAGKQAALVTKLLKRRSHLSALYPAAPG